MAHKTPGESTVDRLFEREDQLKRVSVPNGGEAYTGPEATRALRAMNADAMTVDGSIIVSEGFDASKPGDAALYAHEQYHVDHGRPGSLTHEIHDAEEVAARAVESMVFHRMAGGAESGYQPGAGGGSAGGKTPDHGGRGTSEYNQGSDTKPDTIDTDPDSARGYQALKGQGFSHTDVVDRLGREVMSAIDENKELGLARFSDLKGTI
ncbi:MAG: DUF4157 domain-containing protein [Proteobacteria bacterium]|nr:DUF4157 domain-containing protein [Pseudomonadota bacterium]